MSKFKNIQVRVDERPIHNYYSNIKKYIYSYKNLMFQGKSSKFKNINVRLDGSPILNYITRIKILKIIYSYKLKVKMKKFKIQKIYMQVREDGHIA